MEDKPTEYTVDTPQGTGEPQPELVPPVAPEPMVIAPPPPVGPVVPKEPWFSGNRAIGFVLSIVLLVSAVTAAYLFYRTKTQKPVTQVVAPPTPTPTPTPTRLPSAVATQSAFLSFAEETASLSAALQTYQVADPSLSPPVLDLPLGFSN